MKRWKRKMAALLLAACCLLAACAAPGPGALRVLGESYTLETVPDYRGEPYVVLGDNEPEFLPGELTANSYEVYSPLDWLGRCGAATACVGTDLMPTQDRESLSSVEPAGWQSVRYDCVDGGYLYNRCHLIGYQLTGENANERNLITGTRYLNVDGMLPFENQVAGYVKETGNHVLYRATPIYGGAELVARGVQLEARSVEDGGAGVCFNVYVYNCQPGVEIDYATGESRLAGLPPAENTETLEITYILNVSSRKFHLPDCSGAASIKEKNRRESSDTRDALVEQGYSPCGTCKP